MGWLPGGTPGPEGRVRVRMGQEDVGRLVGVNRIKVQGLRKNNGHLENMAGSVGWRIRDELEWQRNVLLHHLVSLRKQKKETFLYLHPE